MSLWKRGRQYWTDFTVNGRRYRKRLGTTNLRVATRRERELIEEAGHGRLSVDEQGPRRLSEAIEAYLTAKRIRCSARTIELEEERLSIVKKHFWRCAALRDHRDNHSRLPARPSRCRQGESHDQHGRRRFVSGAEVLRPMASARGPREELA